MNRARATRRTLAAGIAATVLASLAGGLATPLAGLPALWLFHVPRGPLRALGVHMLAAVLIVLAAASAARTGSTGMQDAFGALLLLAGYAGGRVRTARAAARAAASESRLAAIDAEANRPETGSPEARAARRIDAVRDALLVAAATAGAERAVVWDADLRLRRIGARMASDGPPGGIWVPMSGSPLGWLAQEGQSLRFEARPPVTARVANVAALRLEHDEAHATLLSLEYGPETEIPPDPMLASIADAVQRVLDDQAERASELAWRARVEILLETLNRLPETIEPDEFARELVRDACRLTSASGGAIALWSDEQGRVLASEGENGGPAAGARFGPGESEVALAARAGAIVEQNLAAKEVGPPSIIAPEETWQRRPAWLLCAPLPVDETMQAILALWSPVPLDRQGLDLLESLVPSAGAQLARTLEFGRVRDSAERDALTGLPNRRAFERALDHERLRFDRYRHPLALLVIDVDHFKAVNDTHGHEAGDAVLRAVALSLAPGLREIDTIARFGGEEFVVLLPETGVPAAAEVGERLRAAVEADSVAWHGTPIRVRVSIGVSSCPACVDSPAELLRSADAALYAAKAGGRNRVEVAPPHASGRSKPSGAERRRP